MRQLSGRAATSVVLFLLSLASAATARAQYGVIYDFELSHGDPVNPAGTLRPDANGTLFGAGGDGTAFDLKSNAHGGFTVQKTPNGPGGTEWVPDEKGNYFTPVLSNRVGDVGMIVEASPAAGGGWTQQVIYTFGAYPGDGKGPAGNLVFDAQGNLYGTTGGGGANDGGTAYELTKGAGGKWTDRILYSFGATSTDAVGPGGLIFDALGNLYGTSGGGPPYYSQFVPYPSYGGTVFELTRQSNGAWAEKILYAFVPSYFGDLGLETTTSGYNPALRLLLDNKGNLFGTTYDGLEYYGSTGPTGVIREGSVFELSPAAGGQWNEQSLLLTCDAQVYCYPNSDLTMDAAGNLYGTTSGGGSTVQAPNGAADTVFKITPQFVQVPLYNLPSVATDGRPSGGVTLLNGSLFGLTANGGPDAYGTAYEIQGVANATPIQTTTTLVANPNGSFAPGEKITLTATVSSATGSLIPVGTVRFADGSGGCTAQHGVTELVVAGKAVYNGVVPSAGSYSVRACYGGGFGFTGSQSSTITAQVP